MKEEKKNGSFQRNNENDRRSMADARAARRADRRGRNLARRQRRRDVRAVRHLSAHDGASIPSGQGVPAVLPAVYSRTDRLRHWVCRAVEGGGAGLRGRFGHRDLSVLRVDPGYDPFSLAGGGVKRSKRPLQLGVRVELCDPAGVVEPVQVFFCCGHSAKQRMVFLLRGGMGAESGFAGTFVLVHPDFHGAV